MKDVLYSDCQKQSYLKLLLHNACQSAGKPFLILDSDSGKQKQLSSSASANNK